MMWPFLMSAKARSEKQTGASNLLRTLENLNLSWRWLRMQSLHEGTQVWREKKDFAFDCASTFSLVTFTDSASISRQLPKDSQCFTSGVLTTSCTSSSSASDFGGCRKSESEQKPVKRTSSVYFTRTGSINIFSQTPYTCCLWFPVTDFAFIRWSDLFGSTVTHHQHH